MMKGNICALVTPFVKNKKISYDKINLLLEKQIYYKSQGFVINGTTAESSNIRFTEQLKIIKICQKKIKKNLPIIVGIGSSSTFDTIRKIEILSHFKVDAILIRSPYYSCPNQVGIIEHYDTISEYSKLPIIIYNVPKRTGIDISYESICKISKNSNVIGIKETSNDLNKIKKISAISNFFLLSGDDELSYNVIADYKAQGVISALSNIAPLHIYNMLNFINHKKNSKAKKIHEDLLYLYKLLNLDINPMPIKQCLSKLQFISNVSRLPLINLSKDNITKLIIYIKKTNWFNIQ